MGSTPQELELSWSPFRDLELTAHAQGYRPMSVELSDDVSLSLLFREVLTLRWKRLMGRAIRSEHELLFIREHGASGTWVPEDARRN